jgi:HD-GYP domain-containing protein (c-di-GMP phosphodiesterase class II)
MRIEFAENERIAGEAFTRLAATTDEFEAYAHPHAVRVARLSDEVAKIFRLSRADRTSLVFASLLHDIGELAMRRDYIKRAGALTDEERLDLARHPVIGEQEASRAGADRGAQLLIRWHHEWWNGAGYPDALRGEQIPLKARILRVADSYAALTDVRPFRPAVTEREARSHLGLWAGLEFDPRVVRVFLSLKGLAELRSYAQPTDAQGTAAATQNTPVGSSANSPAMTPASAPANIPANTETGVKPSDALAGEQETGAGPAPTPAAR